MKCKRKKREDFQIERDGTLKVSGGICVLLDDEIKRQLLEEAYPTPYSMHPGATKLY